MGGERGIMKMNSFHNLLLQHKKAGGSVTTTIKDVPKGCLAIKVGEEQERFVVPVVYFNHPLFLKLLKEAEDEYGFDHKGTITIPCHVYEFRHVQGMIDKGKSQSNRHRHHQDFHHQNHHHAVAGCFRA